jgi:hypothetical protein
MVKDVDDDRTTVDDDDTTTIRGKHRRSNLADWQDQFYHPHHPIITHHSHRLPHKQHKNTTPIITAHQHNHKTIRDLAGQQRSHVSQFLPPLPQMQQRGWQVHNPQWGSR